MQPIINVTGGGGFLGRNLMAYSGGYQYKNITQDRELLSCPARGRYLLHLSDPVTFEKDWSVIAEKSHVAKFSAEFGRDYSHCIYVSSAAVYRKTDSLFCHGETSEFVASDDYACLKMRFEGTIVDKPKVCILRTSNIMGPGLPDGNFFANFFRSLQKEKIVRIRSAYDHIDFVSVDRFFSAIDYIYKNRLSGVYNLSGGSNISLMELGMSVAHAAGNADVVIESEQKTHRFRGVSDKKLRDAGFFHPEKSLQELTRYIMECCPL